MAKIIECVPNFSEGVDGEVHLIKIALSGALVQLRPLLELSLSPTTQIMQLNATCATIVVPTTIGTQPHLPHHRNPR